MAEGQGICLGSDFVTQHQHDCRNRHCEHVHHQIVRAISFRLAAAIAFGYLRER
jgi:hypothetical protein